MPDLQEPQKTAPIPEQDTSPVLAYRVGQLEGAVKVGFQELKDELVKLNSKFTPLEEHNKLEKRVTDLETRKRLRETLMLVSLVITTIISIVALYNLFTGGK